MPSGSGPFPLTIELGRDPVQTTVPASGTFADLPLIPLTRSAFDGFVTVSPRFRGSNSDIFPLVCVLDVLDSIHAFQKSVVRRSLPQVLLDRSRSFALTCQTEATDEQVDLSEKSLHDAEPWGRLATTVRVHWIKCRSCFEVGGCSLCRTLSC